MTIQIEEITHPTTLEALGYTQDYYANYYDPLNPLTSFHRYHHSEHIEVLVTWGYQGDFFVQSRIKLTVLYGLPSDWTDEVAMRGWIFWRNPITGVWSTILESEATSVHHWQEAHQHIKQEATDMALKRAKITAYYPATHKADIQIYPHPGDTMEAVPLAPEIGPALATLLPDCTLAIFYDTDPPSPYITSLLDGVPTAWVTADLLKIDDHVHFHQYQLQWALFHLGNAFPTDPAPVEGQPFYRTDEHTPYYYNGTEWVPFGGEAPPTPPAWLFDTDLEGWEAQSGVVEWFDDGHPTAGCMRLAPNGIAIAYSPPFDSSQQTTVEVTFSYRHLTIYGSPLYLHVWNGTDWIEVWNWFGGAQPWTPVGPIDISDHKNPTMRLRFSQNGDHDWRVDTVQITYP